MGARSRPARARAGGKRGLSVPVARWLRGPLHAWARHRLASDQLSLVGIEPAAALALFDEHTRRQADRGRALWTLLVLYEWFAASGSPANASSRGGARASAWHLAP